MYKALFGLEEKPIEVMNSAMATNIILFAVVIGLTLIMLAMMLNIYSGFKQRNYESAVFGPNGIAGLGVLRLAWCWVSAASCCSTSMC